jgi:hypothetical protein
MMNVDVAIIIDWNNPRSEFLLLNIPKYGDLRGREENRFIIIGYHDIFKLRKHDPGRNVVPITLPFPRTPTSASMSFCKYCTTGTMMSLSATLWKLT